MARLNLIRSAAWLPAMLVFLSMAAISHCQEGPPIFVFDNLYAIAFTKPALRGFLTCLWDVSKIKCDQKYRGANRRYGFSYNFNAKSSLDSENMPDNVELGNTFSCWPGNFAPEDTISCERSPTRPDECETDTVCHLYSVNLEYEGCSSKCINIWWVGRNFETKNIAEYPDFVKGRCKGNNDGNSDDTDTTGLMVAAALGWLFFGLLAGSVLAFLYCWRCRKAFVIHRRNQSEQKFVASRNRSLPNTYGGDQPSSQQGIGNVNKNNGHSNGYTDYNEANDDYTVIDDERMPGVKKENAKTNDAKPANKRVLLHSPYSTIEPNEISEGNSQTANNGHLPKTITGGDASQGNKLSTEATDGYSRLQSGRSAADPQMTKSTILTYNRPSDTVSTNDKGSIDLKRPGVVNKSVHPYKLASAIHDERDESIRGHYKSPPARTTQGIED